MQHLVSNCPIRKVSIGRRKKLNVPGIDDNCEMALARRPTFVLLGIEDYIDI